MPQLDRPELRDELTTAVGALLPFIDDAIADAVWWEDLVPSVVAELLRILVVARADAASAVVSDDAHAPWAGDPPDWFGRRRLLS